MTCIATVKQVDSPNCFTCRFAIVLGYQVNVQEVTHKKSLTVEAVIEYPPIYNGCFCIQMDAMQGDLMGNDMKL